mgnify:CR=1 FL=1
MKKKRVFIIAEIGTNHNGSLKTALSMIDQLYKVDIDAVKFQLANPKDVYSDDAFKAAYQKKNDKSETVLKMSQKLQISKEGHIKLKKRCDLRGITYSCSAFDLESLTFLDKKIKVPFFKIPSGEINSTDIINYISKKNKKIILSTGMATYNEIKNTLKKLKNFGNKKITLLHCISSYPVKENNINLNIIDTLKKKFGCEIGYSDHSIGSQACLAAVAKGAQVIEKHVTISSTQSGPDHKASMNIKDFKKLVKGIRELEIILGSEEKKFSKSELGIKKMARKSLVTIRSLQKGHKIKKSDLTFKRPGTGLSPIMINQIVGKKLKKNIRENKVLKKNHLK